jgi:hypothetical protein
MHRTLFGLWLLLSVACGAGPDAGGAASPRAAGTDSAAGAETAAGADTARAEEASVSRLLGELDLWALRNARDDSWELVLSGVVFRNAKQKELPEGDSVFVGMSVPLVDGEPPSPRTRVAFSALGIRRRGEDIKGKVIYFGDAQGGDAPGREVHGGDAREALGSVQKRFEGHDPPPPLPPAVEVLVRALPGEATQPVTKTAQGFVLAGEAPVEIRQHGSDLLAVGSLESTRSGIRFSVYRPHRAADEDHAER